MYTAKHAQLSGTEEISQTQNQLYHIEIGDFITGQTSIFRLMV
jgi:hypothetical protein